MSNEQLCEQDFICSDTHARNGLPECGGERLIRNVLYHPYNTSVTPLHSYLGHDTFSGSDTNPKATLKHIEHNTIPT